MQRDSNEEREVRAGRNQSMFRAINEQIRAVNDAFAAITETFTIACECADTGCVSVLAIEPAHYRAVRSHPRRFAVLRGHVFADVEDVVEERDGYVVVEKLGAAADVADALDPRAG